MMWVQRFSLEYYLAAGRLISMRDLVKWLKCGSGWSKDWVRRLRGDDKILVWSKGNGVREGRDIFGERVWRERDLRM